MKIRKITTEEAEKIARWIAADPDHAGRTPVEFFTQPGPNEETMAVEDAEGVAFYCKIRRVLRLDIQFGPREEVNADRTIAALSEGFAWLEERSVRAGFKQIVFQSTVAPLVRFCEKRFGFRRREGEMVRELAAITPRAQNAAQPAPQEKR